MEINTINGHTRTLGAPSNWDQSKGECAGLPIMDQETENGPCMISEWQPEANDLKLLNMGMPLHLWIFGDTHPVVSITVGQPTQEILDKTALTQSIFDKSDRKAADRFKHCPKCDHRCEQKESYSQEWLKIETAPEDEIILLAQPDNEVSGVWQIRIGYKSKQYSDFVALGCRDFAPTHWSKTPAGPHSISEEA